MGNVTIASTDDGFKMKSSQPDADTASSLFVDVFKKTHAYTKVITAGDYGEGTGVLGIDEGGSQHYLAWFGPTIVDKQHFKYSFQVYRPDKVEDVRNGTIDALKKAGLSPSLL